MEISGHYENGKKDGGLSLELLRLMFNVFDKFKSLQGYDFNKFTNESSFKTLRVLVNDNNFVFSRDIDLLMDLYLKLLTLNLTYRKRPDDMEYIRNSHISVSHLLLKFNGYFTGVPIIKLFLEDLCKFLSLGADDKAINNYLALLNSGTVAGKNDVTLTELLSKQNTSTLDKIDYYLSNLHSRVTELYNGVVYKDIEKATRVKNDITDIRIDVKKLVKFMIPGDIEFLLIVTNSKEETISKILCVLAFSYILTL